MYGLYESKSLWALMMQGLFPQPVQLSQSIVKVKKEPVIA